MLFERKEGKKRGFAGSLLCSGGGGGLAWTLGVGTMLDGISSEILFSICPWGHFYDTKRYGSGGLHGSDSIFELRGHTSSSMANGHGVLARSLASWLHDRPTNEPTPISIATYFLAICNHHFNMVGTIPVWKGKAAGDRGFCRTYRAKVALLVSAWTYICQSNYIRLCRSTWA